MLQQLNEQYVVNIFVPYIKTKIYPNVDKDNNLRKIFREQEPLKPDERKGLEENQDYFRNVSGSIFQDLKYRKIFWKEFIEYVERQKKVYSDNLQKVAENMLPNPETNVYTTQAQENLFRMARQIVRAVEEDEIRNLIDVKAANARTPEALAKIAADRKKLAEGKLLLVRKKKEGAPFDYMSDEEVKNIVNDTSGQLKEIYREQLFTDETEGVTRVYPFYTVENPNAAGPEKGIAFAGLQRQTWENDLTFTIKRLQESNLEVTVLEQKDANGKPVIEGNKVFPNGFARAFVKDKKTKETLEVTVDFKQPGKRMYKFKFLGGPKKDKSFDLSQEEINKYFVKEQRPATEILEIKEAQKKSREGMPSARIGVTPPTAQPGQTMQQTASADRPFALQFKRGARHLEGAGETAKEKYEREQIENFKKMTPLQMAMIGKRTKKHKNKPTQGSVSKAKEKFAQRLQPEIPIQAGARGRETEPEGRQELGAGKGPMNAIAKAGLITAAGMGAAFSGIGMITGLFS